MAATSLHPITATQARAIAYIINPDKTDQGTLVQSYMCSEDILCGFCVSENNAKQHFGTFRKIFICRSHKLLRH